MRRRAGPNGFTLIELAVVIAIVGLLLGAVLTPLSTQLKVRKNRDAERTLRHAEEALVGFALSRGRLPCPDTDRDGLENLTPGAPPTLPCVSASGFIPWADLDTRAIDPWGRILLYRVAGEFTWPALTGQPPSANRLDIADAGDGQVLPRDVETRVQTPVLAQTAPVVLVSTGANGAGGTYLNGDALAVPAAGTDERDNLELAGEEDGIFVQRVHTPPVGACDEATGDLCEYDDLVSWISGARLIGLLVQAGRLP